MTNFINRTGNFFLLLLFLFTCNATISAMLTPETQEGQYAIYNEEITNQLSHKKQKRKFPNIQNLDEIIQENAQNNRNNKIEETQEYVDPVILRLEKDLLLGYKKQNFKDITNAIKKFNAFKKSRVLHIRTSFDSLFYLAISYELPEKLFKQLLNKIPEFRQNISYPLECVIQNENGSVKAIIIIKNATILHALEYYDFFILYSDQIKEKAKQKKIDISFHDFKNIHGFFNTEIKRNYLAEISAWIEEYYTSNALLSYLLDCLCARKSNSCTCTGTIFKTNCFDSLIRNYTNISHEKIFHFLSSFIKKEMDLELNSPKEYT